LELGALLARHQLLVLLVVEELAHLARARARARARVRVGVRANLNPNRLAHRRFVRAAQQREQVLRDRVLRGVITR